MASRNRLGMEDLVDVRRAAALVGRHPETVRRWVWSGRLAAQRQGNRLLISRADLQALAGNEQRPAASLTAWAESARRAREQAGAAHRGRSAADLIIEDRAERSQVAGADAGR